MNEYSEMCQSQIDEVIHAIWGAKRRTGFRGFWAWIKDREKAKLEKQQVSDIFFDSCEIYSFVHARLGEENADLKELKSAYDKLFMIYKKMW